MDRTEDFDEEHEYSAEEAADFLADNKIINVELGVPFEGGFGKEYGQILIHTERGAILFGACSCKRKSDGKLLHALYFFRNEVAPDDDPTA